MTVIYFFFISLLGIVTLLSLKVWELTRGAKPFSVLRYRLDMLFRKKALVIRQWLHLLNGRTLRLILAFIVANVGEWLSRVTTRVRESHLFKTVKGKVIPGNGNGPVSEFLRDVAEFKNQATGEKSESVEPAATVVEVPSEVTNEVAPTVAETPVEVPKKVVHSVKAPRKARIKTK